MKHMAGVNRTGWQKKRLVDKQQLLNEYRRLKKALGKKPTYSDYVLSSKITSKTMSAIFGKPGWLNLVEEAENKYNVRGRLTTHKLNAITRQQLLDSYISLKKNLGRQPTIVEYYKTAGYVYRELNDLFGTPGWGNMLSSVGDRARQGLRKILNQEHFMADYTTLKNKLHRSPTFREFYRVTHHGDNTLAMHFGRPGWSSLVLAAGDEPRKFEKDDKLIKTEIINNYLSLKNQLGRQPTLKEYYKYTKQTLFIIDRLFGKPGWRNLLKTVGGDKYLYIGRKRLGREHLLDHYAELKGQLGRIPSYMEYADHAKHYLGSLITHFGKPGWHNLIKAAGDTPINYSAASKRGSRANIL